MDVNRSNFESKLKQFFRQFTSKEISGITSINNDLELLVSEIPIIANFLKEEFEIEIKETDLEPYFLDEFNIPFQYLFYKIFRPRKLRKQPLTINHLIEICNKRVWFPPHDQFH